MLYLLRLLLIHRLLRLGHYRSLLLLDRGLLLVLNIGIICGVVLALLWSTAILLLLLLLRRRRSIRILWPLVVPLIVPAAVILTLPNLMRRLGRRAAYGHVRSSHCH